MSPALSIDTRSLPDVTAIIVVRLSLDTATDPGSDRAGDARLGSACQAALTTHAAMGALSASVADMTPSDPRHAAAYAASDLLRQRWRTQLAQVCRLPATGQSGLAAKSRLLSRLIDRDADDAVLGGPVAEVAASLADDVLASGGLPGA